MVNFATAKAIREQFFTTFPIPVNGDDRQAPDFYQAIFTQQQIQHQDNLGIIIVAHAVHTLPPFIEAAATLGEVVCLILKQSRTVPEVRDFIAQRYADIIFVEASKNTLLHDAARTDAFLQQLVQLYPEKRFLIFDHGGYFANRMPDVLPNYRSQICGIIEHTLNGHLRYQHPGNRPFCLPVASIAQSRLKQLEDDVIGDSIATAIMVGLSANSSGLNLDYDSISKVLVIGYGHIGSGVAKVLQAKNPSKKIYVHDLNHAKASLVQRDLTNGVFIADKSAALQGANLIIIASSGIALTQQEFLELEPEACIACVTSSDDLFSEDALRLFERPEDTDNIVTPYIYRGQPSRRIFLMGNGDSINFRLGSTAHPILHGVLALNLPLAHHILNCPDADKSSLLADINTLDDTPTLSTWQLHYEGAYRAMQDKVLYLDAFNLTSPIFRILQVNILLKLKDHAHRFAEEIDLAQLTQFYVELGVIHRQTSADQQPMSLQSHLESFIDSGKKVCMLIGNAGAGKTLYSCILQNTIWDSYLHTDEMPKIPIRIDLKRHTQESASHCVHAYLSETMQLSPEQIALLKQTHAKFIFIFDALDELQGGGIARLYQDNNLAEWGVAAQAVVLFRHDYTAVEKDYKAFLGPGREHNVDATIELQIAPLSLEQMMHYIERQHAEGYLQDDLEQCGRFVRAVPGLSDIISTPYLLKVFVSAYPVLKRNYDQTESAEAGITTEHPTTVMRPIILSESDLLDAFMQAWFEREQQRIIDIIPNESQRFNLRECFLNFSRRLAFAMFKANTNVIICEDTRETIPSDDEEELPEDATAPIDINQLIHKEFFAPRAGAFAHARRGCPLRCVNGTQFSFMHQSFLEHFTADKMWHALIKADLANARSMRVLLKTWGARHLTHPAAPTIIDMLSVRLQQASARSIDAKETSHLYDMLLQLVTLSKKSHTQTCDAMRQHQHIVAASNAMTILNNAGISLTYKMADSPDYFREIQIPYAWLQTGDFYHIDFSDSDFSYVDLTGAKLTGTIFNRCDMTGVELQQLPFIQVSNNVACITYSPDGKLLAVSQQNRINLYQKTDFDWHLIKTLFAEPDSLVTTMAFTPMGHQVAAGYANGVTHLWNISDPKTVTIVQNADAVALWSTEQQSVTLTLAGTAQNVWLTSPSGNQTEQANHSHWQVEQESQSLALVSQSGTLRSIAFSADGEWLATAGDVLCLWHIRGKICRYYSPPAHRADHVSCVAFSSHHNWLAYGTNSGDVYLWDLAEQVHPIELTDFFGFDDIFSNDSSRMRLVALKPHSAINSVAFSADGKWLAIGGEDETILVWDLHRHPLGRDNPPTQLSLAPCGSITCMAFSADSQSLATQSGRTVLIYHISGELRETFIGHCGKILSVCFSKDGGQLATAGNDLTVRFWQISSQIIPSLGVCSYSSDINNILRLNSIANDMSLAHHFGGTAFRSIEQYNPNEMRGWLSASLDHSLSIIKNAHVQFSADGNRLISFDNKSSVVLMWGVNGELERLFSNNDYQISSATFSPNGEQLALAYKNKSIHLVDFKGNTSFELDFLFSIKQISFSQDGKRILCMLNHGLVIFNLDNIVPGKNLNFIIHERVFAKLRTNNTAQFEDDFCQRANRILEFNRALDDRITCATFLPQTPFILVGSKTGEIKLLHTRDPRQDMSFNAHDNSITCLATSLDGTLLATGCEDYTISVWELDALFSTKELSVFQINKHHKRVTCVAFSPCGKWLASSCDDGIIHLSHLNDVHKAMQLQSDIIEVTCVAFSADGSLLASASMDSSVHLWRKDHDGNWCQLWQRHRKNRLQCTGVSLKDVLNLSPLNQRLLEQVGSYHAPVGDTLLLDNLRRVSSRPPSQRMFPELALSMANSSIVEIMPRLTQFCQSTNLCQTVAIKLNTLLGSETYIAAEIMEILPDIIRELTLYSPNDIERQLSQSLSTLITILERIYVEGQAITLAKSSDGFAIFMILIQILLFNSADQLSQDESTGIGSLEFNLRIFELIGSCQQALEQANLDNTETMIALDTHFFDFLTTFDTQVEAYDIIGPLIDEVFAILISDAATIWGEVKHAILEELGDAHLQNLDGIEEHMWEFIREELSSIIGTQNISRAAATLLQQSIVAFKRMLEQDEALRQTIYARLKTSFISSYIKGVREAERERRRSGQQGQQASASLQSMHGIFQGRRPTNRVGLGLNIPILREQLGIAEGLTAGTAFDDGGCFFDALAQALNALQQTDCHTEKTLRQLCHQYYCRDPHCKSQVTALNTADANSYPNDDYLFVQYTTEELAEHYDGRAPIWGRPHVEGMLLCRQLNLECIIIIELLEDPDNQELLVQHYLEVKQTSVRALPAGYVVDFASQPCLIVSQHARHFVPILPGNVPAASPANTS